LRETVRDTTAEARACSDDQQVAWIDGGAIASSGICHVILLLNAR